MKITKRQLRKIIREVLLESDETKKMDASIFKMLAPASRANLPDREESKPKIISPKPLKFNHQSFAGLIVMKLSDIVKLTDYVDAVIINAGDGTHEHPTQALLDMMSIKVHRQH